MNKEYAMNPNGSYHAVFVVVAEILFCGVFLVVLLWLLGSNQNSALHARLSKGIPAYAGIVLISFILLPCHTYPLARSFWRSHYWITLSNYEVVGKNLWQQSTRVPLANINHIRPEPRALFRWNVPTGIDIISEDGTIIRVHPHIERFGECVQEIQKRCPNLVEVDYGGLDKKPAIWDAADKAM